MVTVSHSIPQMNFFEITPHHITEDNTVQVTEYLRKVSDEGFLNLLHVTSRYVAHMGGMKISYKPLVAEPDGNRAVVTPMLILQVSGQMNHKENLSVDWMKLDEDNVQTASVV
jgi:hypothetical protein